MGVLASSDTPQRWPKTTADVRVGLIQLVTSRSYPCALTGLITTVLTLSQIHELPTSPIYASLPSSNSSSFNVGGKGLDPIGLIL
jgi:hypothetical protein